MIQIAYVSSTRGLLTADEMTDLLVTSRARNHAHAITGVLLYKGGNVLQVIEGDESDVLTLYSSIEKDRRHTGVIKIYQKNIVSRDFSEWTMAFHDLNAPHARELEGFSGILDANFDMRSISPSSAARLLGAFKADIR
jgi:hypothetical protein